MVALQQRKKIVNIYVLVHQQLAKSCLYCTVDIVVASKMTTKVSDGPEYLDVSSWLAELHMECYKKHLEDYETIKVSRAVRACCNCAVELGHAGRFLKLDI